MSFPKTLHLFCRVIDNFGDIGVCWRLARQLALEYGIDVTLWVDDLNTLKRIHSSLDPTRGVQKMAGITVRRWPVQFGPVGPHETGDVVIEAFACELPAVYVEAMEKRTVPPVWINLEYLSAEEWVEGCHRMISPHPSSPLVKHFFFPGFTPRTGGLTLEKELFARRDRFQSDVAASRSFLKSLGVEAPDRGNVVSLFCYPHAPVTELFAAFAADNVHPLLCLVPEGVAGEAVSAFLGQPARAGAFAEQGGLRTHVIPFVDQDDYDRLLWACDLNFVRGEDSFVRAQWAAHPFIWQIYPQEDQTHELKLNAFLGRYLAGLDKEQSKAVSGFWRGWNGMDAEESGMEAAWKNFFPVLPELAQYGPQWAHRLAENGDLASNLIGFVHALR